MCEVTEPSPEPKPQLTERREHGRRSASVAKLAHQECRGAGCFGDGNPAQQTATFFATIEVDAEGVSQHPCPASPSIYISEYDVDVVGDEAQLRIFEQQFPLFYNHPQVVGITLWGYHEGATWSPNTHLMLVDGTYRPAFEWLTYHSPTSAPAVTAPAKTGKRARRVRWIAASATSR